MLLIYLGFLLFAINKINKEDRRNFVSRFADYAMIWKGFTTLM